MKKIITSFLIFVFVSLSFSLPTFAEYDTRQLPWNLPEKLEEYKESHKYILIYENLLSDGSKEVYLLYSHLPFSFTRRSTSYPSYIYKRAENLVYKLIGEVFVFQYITTSDSSFYFQVSCTDDDGLLVHLDYNEWLPNRYRLDWGTYPIASNVNLDFGGNEWDMSNGLYDLPPPELPPPDDDDDHSGLIGGIVGGILNGLKSLFIPERNIFVDIVNKFNDKFPIVGQISNLISNLYNIGEVEPVFKFVYDGIELKIIDFSFFADYMPMIRNFTGAFLFLSFITREIKKLPGLIRGRE